MSKMGEVILDIQEDISDGNLTYREIAKKYGVPVDWVRAAAVDLVGDYNEYSEMMKEGDQ